MPRKKQEGGTYVIPGHGRLADEADVVEYRDMSTIIRDRFADAAKKKQTLAQVKAAGLVRDYEGRYGAAQGFWTTDAFVEAVYRTAERAGGQGGTVMITGFMARRRVAPARVMLALVLAGGASMAAQGGQQPAAPQPPPRRAPARRSISPATGCRSSTKTGAGGW